MTAVWIIGGLILYIGFALAVGRVLALSSEKYLPSDIDDDMSDTWVE